MLCSGLPCSSENKIIYTYMNTFLFIFIFHNYFILALFYHLCIALRIAN